MSAREEEARKVVKTTQEVIEEARGIADRVVTKLKSKWYEPIQGSLEFRWTEEFGAFADSPGIAGPPEHKIIFGYDLACVIYRFAVEHCAVAATEFSSEKFDPIFGALLPNQCGRLPPGLSQSECVQMMFTTALTWVIYHEVGHLAQEHGYIREHFAPRSGRPTRISEIEAAGIGEVRKGRSAAVDHVTEMAADYWATTACLADLLIEHRAGGKAFINSVYMLVCGITSLLYCFYGNKPGILPEKAEGSHPNPTMRLEFLVPQVVELLKERPIQDIGGYQLDRLAIEMKIQRAANSAIMYFTGNYVDLLDQRLMNFQVRGLNRRPEMRGYISEIVVIWNEISPEVNRVLRFGDDTGLPEFSTDAQRYYSRE